MAISFDGVLLDGTGSMANFSSGYPKVMDLPARVTNSPSRPFGIVLLSTDQSVPFTATYLITNGVDHSGSTRTEYDVIKAKQGVIGTLIVDSDSIDNIALKMVSLPAMANGMIRCTLSFELVEIS